MILNDIVEKAIEDCINNKQYFGLGNPNAKILFVGKEAGMPTGSEFIHGSGESWRKNDYSKRFQAEGAVRHGRHTWQRYQKLYELIIGKLQIQDESLMAKMHEITFVENVFATELSNLPAPTTKEAKKNPDFIQNLKKRKEEFWRSEFISRFPIIIITALDNKYIETYQGEVCELFDVKFCESESAAKIWVHYATNENKVFPKLLIHTRQLTNGASNSLLEKIADIVKDFVIRNNIELRSIDSSAQKSNK